MSEMYDVRPWKSLALLCLGLSMSFLLIGGMTMQPGHSDAGTLNDGLRESHKSTSEIIARRSDQRMSYKGIAQTAHAPTVAAEPDATRTNKRLLSLYVHEESFTYYGCHGQNTRELMRRKEVGVYTITYSGKSVRLHDFVVRRMEKNVFYRVPDQPTLDRYTVNLGKRACIESWVPGFVDGFTPFHPLLKFEYFVVPYKQKTRRAKDGERGLYRLSTSRVEPAFAGWWAYTWKAQNGRLHGGGPYTCSDVEGHFRFSGHLERVVDSKTFILQRSHGSSVLMVKPATFFFSAGYEKDAYKDVLQREKNAKLKEEWNTLKQFESVMIHTTFRIIVACSPKVDPDVMRVSTAREGQETFDEEEARQASHGGADYPEAA